MAMSETDWQALQVICGPKDEEEAEEAEETDGEAT
jgi:hypothetical protein